MTTYTSEHIQFSGPRVTRRRFIQTASASGTAIGALSFREQMAVQAEELRKQGRSMILLWMSGGPSQLETFDPKPNHKNSGDTKAISTSVPGIQIAHDWTNMAQVMNDVAVIRSMTNKEGNHQRATYQMHTGYVPTGSVKHPSFGSLIAQQLANQEADLPSVVSIGRTVGAGFLGVNYEPFVVDRPGEMPQNISIPDGQRRLERRLNLLQNLEGSFGSQGAEQAVQSHQQLYSKAAKFVFSNDTQCFDLADEPQQLRDQYGDSAFGRGCLLARRLIERGVTFVEVQKNGWDTHDTVFERVSELASEVDVASAALITDLKNRGLLDRTLVVWAGEFGRTPQVNARGGRDHFPRAFNCWLAGGGVRGGQTIGSTTEDGSAVKDRPVTVPDLLQSISHSLKIDSAHENMSPQGRPLKVVDGGEVVQELFS